MQLAFQPFLLEDNHDLGLKYTISQLPLLTPIMFKCSTWSFMMAINRVTTTIVNGILSCLHSNLLFIRGKSWKIRLFPKPVGKISKTSILPTRCFKQFLCSSRLAFDPRLGSHLALWLLRVRILRDGMYSLSSPRKRISLCDRRRSTVDKNCQNQPIRGYTRIWYTGTHFC